MTSIEEEILVLCRDSLSIKSRIIKGGVWDFRCYLGGGRKFDLHNDKGIYLRTIYMSRDSKRFENIPEDVIDLNEIYHIYRVNNNLTSWSKEKFNPNFLKVIYNLKNKGLILILKTIDVMAGLYHPTPFTPEEQEPRFIKLSS